MRDGIDKLIINSAYREPQQHWSFTIAKGKFERSVGRRPAGYFVSGQGNNAYNEDGEFRPLELVNQIRPLVKKWREAGYPGVTGVTKKLLEHWRNPEAREYQFFWCQLDAIETLIWLTEAPAANKVGIKIHGDGGNFTRLCTKLCTGGGKTIVMAMLIAWQVCNKAAYPKDSRFSKHVLVVAPGLTVKSRLQVLLTGGQDNYYAKFGVVPNGLEDKLRQGKVVIANWQAMAWDSDEAIAKKRSVDKRGAKSDEAYTREVLRELASARNILVINDEAHHAWRKNPEVKLTREQKEAEREATIWISGLDRIHRTRGIRTCFDFSATPFAPSGKKNNEEAVFSWIVSDFGLNDGIESGLVKTPRIPVRDDAVMDPKTNRPRFNHIYIHETVKDDINQAVPPETPLPQLIRDGYYILGKDWLKTFKEWKLEGFLTPPVMITVANRTETAARIKYAFDHKVMPLGNIPELCVPELTLHIDSKALDAADEASSALGQHEDSDEDAGERKLSKKDAVAILRKTVDTIGQSGKRGEQIRNVISVGMLSEGWDAKTVTHIMGLRAFSSQLLCEQVIGRGLRRTTYDLEEGSDLFAPEYVEIFGIPFKFLPHESDESGTPKPPKPKTQIEVLPEKAQYQITWPNIMRFDRVMNPVLSVDMANIPTLVLDASKTTRLVELAPVIEGKPDFTRLRVIDLEKLDSELRLQTVVFETAKETYGLAAATWKEEGTPYGLFGQVIRLVEEFLSSRKIQIDPPLFNTEPLRRRIMCLLNMSLVVNHIWDHIRGKSTEKIIPILDSRPIRSTGDMQTWYTSKKCQITQKSHISHCIFDSSWEATEQGALERNEDVVAWAKNDHLGFEIIYTFEGVVRKYRPDFLVRLSSGKTLVLEVKGQRSAQNDQKHKAMEEWVNVVNTMGEYGMWAFDVSYNVADVDGIIAKWVGE